MDSYDSPFLGPYSSPQSAFPLSFGSEPGRCADQGFCKRSFKRGLRGCSLDLSLSLYVCVCVRAYVLKCVHIYTQAIRA